MAGFAEANLLGMMDGVCSAKVEWLVDANGAEAGMEFPVCVFDVGFKVDENAAVASGIEAVTVRYRSWSL